MANVPRPLDQLCGVWDNPVALVAQHEEVVGLSSVQCITRTRYIYSLATN